MSESTPAATQLRAPVVQLPPRNRLEIMRLALDAACKLEECSVLQGKEDAAIVIAAILSALDTLNRRSVLS